MCHKLAEALQVEFPDWHVDCEYNRDFTELKVLPDVETDEDHSVFPDIIVHHRGTPENLLVIEAKCSDSSPTLVKKDRVKLSNYLVELSYHYAALVTFNVRPFADVSYVLQKGE